MDPHSHSNGVSEEPPVARPVARNTVLLEVRDALLESPMSEGAVRVIRSVPPATLIKAVATVEPHDSRTARQLLSLYHEKVPEDLREEFNSALFLSLQDPDSDVRRIAIEEIYKTTQADPAALPIAAHLEGYIAVAELVGDADLSTFNKAISITSQQDVSRHPRLLDGLKRPLNSSSQSSIINAYEVIVNLSCRSESNFRQCSEAGHIEALVSEVNDCTDFLYELNILELIKKLALTSYGLSYVIERGLLEKLSDRIAAQNKHPMRTIILPGYLKFFGSIAHVDPKLAFFRQPAVWEHLAALLLTAEGSLLAVALDTLGQLGATVEGKLCLAEQGAKYTSLVSKVGEYIRDSSTDIKTRALSCMADLIGVEKEPKMESGLTDQRVTLMTREWFRSIAAQPMAMLHSICKNPFPDIRLAGFELLDAVCQHAWGQELVAATPGFIEFLLDRSTDHTKESKEAKFLVVRRLSRSAAFDPTVTLKMTSYVEQGAYFAEISPEVAMEEGD